MAEGATAVIKQGRYRVRPWQWFSGWVAVAVLVLLWWAAHYTSLVAVLAEWQFRQFGRYYPTLTYTLFALAVTVPIAMAIRMRSNARRQGEQQELSTEDVEDRLNLRALVSARRGIGFFAWLAIVAGAVALGIAVTISTLPTGAGEVRAVDAGSRYAREGNSRMVGRVDIGFVGRFVEDLVIARRLIFIAPVRPGHGDAPMRNQIRYFTVVVPSGGDRTFVPISSGVLVRGGLPKEVLNLYRAAGLDVADDAYLLMKSDAQVRWRPVVLAVEAAAFSLLAMLFWALFRRHHRVLQRDIEKSRLTPR